MNLLGFSVKSPKDIKDITSTPAHNTEHNPAITGPGTRTGTIGSEYDQAVGVERLELLSKLAGKSLFSSSQLLCHSKGEAFKGTLSDPVLVETLASESDAESAKERIVGCSGVPKGSHEIGYFWLRSGGGRCPECGQAFALKPIL